MESGDNEPVTTYETVRKGPGRRPEDGEIHVAPCDKVLILSTEVPILSRNVLVIDTKMTVGIGLLLLISSLLLGQTLYQIPVLRDAMNKQDSAIRFEIKAVEASGNANKAEIDILKEQVSDLEGAAYVLRSDIQTSRRVEKKNTHDIKKNNEANRPKGFFGR